MHVGYDNVSNRCELHMPKSTPKDVALNTPQDLPTCLESRAGLVVGPVPAS